MQQWSNSKKTLGVVFGVSAALAIGLAFVGNIVMGQDTSRTLMPVPTDTTVPQFLVQLCQQAKSDKSLLLQESNGHTYGYWMSLYDIDPDTCAVEPHLIVPTTTTDVPAAVNSEPYYKDCKAAWAAHAAPLHRGQPGYRSQLDRDGDGTACETKP